MSVITRSTSATVVARDRARVRISTKELSSLRAVSRPLSAVEPESRAWTTSVARVRLTGSGPSSVRSSSSPMNRSGRPSAPNRTSPRSSIRRIRPSG